MTPEQHELLRLANLYQFHGKGDVAALYLERLAQLAHHRTEPSDAVMLFSLPFSEVYRGA